MVAIRSAKAAVAHKMRMRDRINSNSSEHHRELRVGFRPVLDAVRRDLGEVGRVLRVGFLAPVFLVAVFLGAVFLEAMRALVVFRLGFVDRFVVAGFFFFAGGDADFGFRFGLGVRFLAAPIAAPESAPITVPTTGMPNAVPATAPATAPPKVLPAVPLGVSVSSSTLLLSSMFSP